MNVIAAWHNRHSCIQIHSGSQITVILGSLASRLPIGLLFILIWEMSSRIEREGERIQRKRRGRIKRQRERERKKENEEERGRRGERQRENETIERE